MPKNRGVVIVKHSNPCGVSIEKNKLKSYTSAINCDPISLLVELLHVIIK